MTIFTGMTAAEIAALSEGASVDPVFGTVSATTVNAGTVSAETVETTDFSATTAEISTLSTNDLTIVDTLTAPQVLDASQNAYIRTDSGTKDILAAAAADRFVTIVVTVTTVFANGDGAQPTVSIGEESGSASKFAATTKFTSAAAGATFAFAGTLTLGKKLQATLVAATGTTSTGAYTINIMAMA